jgi:cytochrome b involved in lipid metabolism
MKPVTKTIIFVVAAFIIVIIITVVKSNTVVAPSVNDTSASKEAIKTNAQASTSTATYTLADVAKHKTATDCWTAVGDGVFNLTPFVTKHPGGVENITKICGIDGTAPFTKMHGTMENAKAVLASLRIGTLK